MKIKKNLAIKLVKELIQDENFKKDIIDLISATSDSSGIAKNEEKKIFNNLLKVHKKTVDDVMVPRGEIIFICLLYTSPSPRDLSTSRMPSSA